MWPVDGRSDSRDMRIHIGDRIVVHLGYGHNPSYAWHLDPIDTTLFEAADPVLIPNADVSVADPGGVEVWAFEAKAAGSTTLHWEYYQGGVVDHGPTMDSLTITVEVLS